MMRTTSVRDIATAIAAHGLLFVLLAVGFHFGSVTDQANPGTEKAVQAVTIDESVIDDQHAEKEAEAKARAKAEQEAAREAEALRQAQAEKEAEAKAKAEAEAKAKAEAEEKARREAEAKAKREAEARAKAEAEAKREAQAAAAEAKAKREAEEQARRVAEARGTFDGAIRRRIERAWSRPAGVPEGLSCVVAVRLGPGGSVLTVNVVSSSGNAAFDRSAETAVLRADPLPMPDEPALAAPYRQGVELVFDPDE